jgi:L-threonylcarbamoyladenylate synthase
MDFNQQFNTEIEKCLETLHKGGIIIYPTDTVWGIGCDATNASAVKKIYKLKRRTESKALIVLVSETNMAEKYVKSFPELARDLISNYQKPLTIVYPNAINLAKNLIDKDGSIAIRISRDKFSSDLITRFGKPIVSTSANISGQTMPISFRNISNEIIKGADYVVTIYHNTINEVKPSTIIKLESETDFRIIRD